MTKGDGRVELILADVLRLPASGVSDDVMIRDTGVWDSLKHLELIIALEQAFAIELTFDEIVSMQSVRSIKRVLRERGVLG